MIILMVTMRITTNEMDKNKKENEMDEKEERDESMWRKGISIRFNKWN